jgi:hypothetical protein
MCALITGIIDTSRPILRGGRDLGIVGKSIVAGVTFLIIREPIGLTQLRKKTNFVDWSIVRTCLAASSACFFSSLLLSEDLRNGLPVMTQSHIPIAW